MKPYVLSMRISGISTLKLDSVTFMGENLTHKLYAVNKRCKTSE